MNESDPAALRTAGTEVPYTTNEEQHSLGSNMQINTRTRFWSVIIAGCCVCIGMNYSPPWLLLLILAIAFVVTFVLK